MEVRGGAGVTASHWPEFFFASFLVLVGYTYAVRRKYPWALRIKARIDAKLDAWTEQAHRKTLEWRRKR